MRTNHGALKSLLLAEMSNPLWASQFDAPVTKIIITKLMRDFADMLKARMAALPTSPAYFKHHRYHPTDPLSIKGFGVFFVANSAKTQQSDPYHGGFIYKAPHRIPKFKTWNAAFTTKSGKGAQHPVMTFALFNQSGIDAMMCRRFIIALVKIIKGQVQLGNSVTMMHVGQFSPYMLVGRYKPNKPHIPANWIAPRLKMSVQFADRILQAVL